MRVLALEFGTQSSSHASWQLRMLVIHLDLVTIQVNVRTLRDQCEHAIMLDSSASQRHRTDDDQTPFKAIRLWSPCAC